MSDWLIDIIPTLAIGAGFVSYVKTIVSPIKEKVDDIIAREIEKEKEEQRMRSLEGWTGNQQDDLDELNEGVIILAGAVSALLDHTIVKQEGNGKCHKAQAKVDAFLEGKAMNKKSH